MTLSKSKQTEAAQRKQQEVHDHPINEVHAAFWGVAHNTVTTAMYHVNDTLPARRHSLMPGEVKEIVQMGMARLTRDDRRPDIEWTTENRGAQP